MTTRVTQGMLNQNMLFNLHRNYGEMEKTQEQASSGKKISKASDDPVTAVRGMFYRSSLNEIEQYKRNTSDGISWMTATDEALDEVTSVLHRAKELTVQGLNGTNGESDRQAIVAEIKQLKEHLGEIANTQMSGRYLFAGTDTKNPPYRADAQVAGSPMEFRNQNQGALELQVGQTNNVQINVLGVKVFNNDGAGGLFKVFDDLVAGLQNPNGGSSEHLSKLEGQLDNLLKERSELGARMNRMELSMSRVDGLELSTIKMLSNEEDVDISRVIINLKTQENIQRAALSVGASIIQPSLVDFLR